MLFWIGVVGSVLVPAGLVLGWWPLNWAVGAADVGFFATAVVGHLRWQTT